MFHKTSSLQAKVLNLGPRTTSSKAEKTCTIYMFIQ